MSDDQKTGDPLLDAILDVSIIPATDGTWFMTLVMKRQINDLLYRGVTVEIDDDGDFMSPAPYPAELNFTVMDGNVVHAMIIPLHGVTWPLSTPGRRFSPFGKITFTRGRCKRVLSNKTSVTSFKARPIPTPTE